MAYKRGHCKDDRVQKPGAQDWYRAIEREHLARIEREYAAKQAQPPRPPQDERGGVA